MSQEYPIYANTNAWSSVRSIVYSSFLGLQVLFYQRVTYFGPLVLFSASTEEIRSFKEAVIIAATKLADLNKQ